MPGIQMSSRIRSKRLVLQPREGRGAAVGGLDLEPAVRSCSSRRCRVVRSSSTTRILCTAPLRVLWAFGHRRSPRHAASRLAATPASPASGRGGWRPAQWRWRDPEDRATSPEPVHPHHGGAGPRARRLPLDRAGPRAPGAPPASADRGSRGQHQRRRRPRRRRRGPLPEVGGRRRLHRNGVPRGHRARRRGAGHRARRDPEVGAGPVPVRRAADRRGRHRGRPVRPRPGLRADARSCRTTATTATSRPRRTSGSWWRTSSPATTGPAGSRPPARPPRGTSSCPWSTTSTCAARSRASPARSATSSSRATVARAATGP